MLRTLFTFFIFLTLLHKNLFFDILFEHSSKADCSCPLYIVFEYFLFRKEFFMSRKKKYFTVSLFAQRSNLSRAATIFCQSHSCLAVRTNCSCLFGCRYYMAYCKCLAAPNLFYVYASLPRWTCPLLLVPQAYR